jgi:hypothetical protein
MDALSLSVTIATRMLSRTDGGGRRSEVRDPYPRTEEWELRTFPATSHLFSVSKVLSGFCLPKPSSAQDRVQSDHGAVNSISVAKARRPSCGVNSGRVPELARSRLYCSVTWPPLRTHGPSV